MQPVLLGIVARDLLFYGIYASRYTWLEVGWPLEPPWRFHICLILVSLGGLVLPSSSHPASHLTLTDSKQ